MPIRRDYTGKKYHKLRMITQTRPGGAGVGTTWLAECECGNTKEVIAKDVVRGRVKSCGKCPEDITLLESGVPRNGPRNATERRLLGRYVRKSFREGVTWALSIEQLRGLLGNECFMCGVAANECSLELVKWAKQGDYTLENVIACCPECIDVLGKAKVADRLTHITVIYHHLQKHLTTNK